MAVRQASRALRPQYHPQFDVQPFANLQFAGSPSLPRDSRSMLQEGSEELSWLSAEGSHRVKLGVLLNRERSTTGAVPNRYGTFLFNSLSDLDSGKAALYARTLAGKDNFAGSDNAAVYLGDAYRRLLRRVKHSFIVGLANDSIGYQVPFAKWDNGCHACAPYVIAGVPEMCPVQPIDCDTVFLNNVGRQVDPAITSAVGRVIQALE